MRDVNPSDGPARDVDALVHAIGPSQQSSDERRKLLPLEGGEAVCVDGLVLTLDPLYVDLDVSCNIPAFVTDTQPNPG